MFIYFKFKEKPAPYLKLSSLSDTTVFLHSTSQNNFTSYCQNGEASSYQKLRSECNRVFLLGKKEWWEESITFLPETQALILNFFKIVTMNIMSSSGILRTVHLTIIKLNYHTLHLQYHHHTRLYIISTLSPISLLVSSDQNNLYHDE